MDSDGINYQKQTLIIPGHRQLASFISVISVDCDLGFGKLVNKSML